MKYEIGGISGKTGDTVKLEVAVQGTPAGEPPGKAAVDKPAAGKPASKPSAKPAEGAPRQPAGGADAPGGDREPAPAASGTAPADAKPTVRPDYPLLPEDLKAKYLSMSFTLDGEQVEISLEHLKYQNLGLHLNFKEATKNVIVGLFNETKKKDAALLEELAGPLASGGPVFVMHAFSGKGSPEQIRACLKIAGHFKKRLGRDWQEKGTLSASLSSFYFENMGLDCSGFAGNYARAVGGTPLEPNSAIPSFAPAGKRRKKLDEILPGDLIIWGKRHIATIQGRRSDGHFDIVESSGETEVQGLGNTVRELTETGGDSMHIRKVHQGGKLGGSEEVYVATIK